MLTKCNRLTNAKDFKKAYQYGQPFRGKFLFIKLNLSNGLENRFGIVVGKNNVPKATQRNLLKRRMRSIIQKYPLGSTKKFDIVIGFNKNVSIAEFGDLEKDYSEFLRVLENKKINY